MASYIAKQECLEDTLQILELLGIKKKATNMKVLVLRTMLGLKPDDPWESSTNEWLRIHDIIEAINNNYHDYCQQNSPKYLTAKKRSAPTGKIYEENSRESVRKKPIRAFLDIAIAESTHVATNSGNTMYRITDEFVNAIRTINTDQSSFDVIIKEQEERAKKYKELQESYKVPIEINGETINFSTGEHNRLQGAVIHGFMKQFAKDAHVVYICDTQDKINFSSEEELERIGLSINAHDKLPDIILFDETKSWLYFVEAVYSGGEMSKDRIKDLETIVQGLRQDLRNKVIYVSAFLDRATYRKYSDNLAWETEAWIADEPDHMIHMNGDRFLGPH